MGPRWFQDHIAEVLCSSGTKTLYMTGLHDASTPSLQDQQMVGAICGLEDFLSNVNIFCLQALLPGHCSINVLQLALKPESSHSRLWSQDAAVEVMYSPPVKAGRV